MSSRDWLLLSFLVFQTCIKCCDMGRTHLFVQDNPIANSADYLKQNYIKMTTGQTPYLILNSWTKTCTSNCRAVKEPLEKGFVEAIKLSVRLFPRRWLFTGSKARPFASPNSYGQWFKRSLQRLFNKHGGVTLWRHSFINSDVILNTPLKERQRLAKMCLHSSHQQSEYKLDVKLDRMPADEHIYRAGAGDPCGDCCIGPPPSPPHSQASGSLQLPPSLS
jgi:hypothetical protein